MEARIFTVSRYMSRVFEDAAVGIVEVDTDDRFVAVNARFCQMLGYAREELLGRSLHEITALRAGCPVSESSQYSPRLFTPCPAK